MGVISNLPKVKSIGWITGPTPYPRHLVDSCKRSCTVFRALAYFDIITCILIDNPDFDGHNLFVRESLHSYSLQTCSHERRGFGMRERVDMQTINMSVSLSLKDW
jgi:hypothetical protein